MKEKIYSVSSYSTDKTSNVTWPLLFFKNIENAEKMANELNQKVSIVNIHYLVETFRLEDF